MTFVMAGELRMQADQAIAELRETKAAQEAVIGTSGKMQASSVRAANDNRRLKSETKGAAGATTELGAAAQSTSTSVGALGAQERQAAADGEALANSQRRAAGSTGNLIAQFNDIGVMLAAGQNPLQLAIQQGTQITQVVGPMGATGAVKALGGAFLGMLNPLNFAIIGSIAAGAMLTQWITGTTEDALTLEEAVGGLTDQIERYTEASQAAQVDTADLRAEFGQLADVAQVQLKRIAELERIKVGAEIELSLDTLIDESDLDLNSFKIDDFNELSGLFNLRWFNGSAWRDNKKLLDEIIHDFRNLREAAASGNFDDQVTALERLTDNFNRAANASGEVTATEAERLLQLEELLKNMRELQALDTKNQRDPQIAAQQQYAESRLKSAEFLKRTLEEELRKASEANRLYAETRLLSDQQTASVQQQISALTQANALRATEAEHGRNSSEAVALRHEQERQALEVELSSLPVAESFKEAKREALHAAQELEKTNIENGVAAASAAAQKLAERLGISLGLAQRLAAMGPQGGETRDKNGKQYSGRGGDPRSQGGRAQDWNTRDVDQFLEDWKQNQKDRTSGASAIERERAAIARLLADQRRQVAILKETDPVQKEMIRYREQMAKATDAERTELEKLIRTRLSEEQGFERAKQGRDLFLSTSFNALEAMAVQGTRTADIWDQVRAALVRAALQATLLGQGPLAGIMGLGGKGGILGIFASAVGLADGGPVWGMGGDREDKVPAFLSPDEFVVNAKSTRKHRPLLNLINSDADIPGFADGGSLNPAQQAGPSFAPQSGPSRTLIELKPSPLFRAEMQETAQDVAIELIDDYDKEVAPETIKSSLDDDRSIG